MCLPLLAENKSISLLKRTFGALSCYFRPSRAPLGKPVCAELTPASLNLRLATCLKWLGACQRHGVPAGVRPVSAFVGVRCARRGHDVPSVHQTSSQQIDGFCRDTSEHVLFSQCPPLCKYEGSEIRFFSFQFTQINLSCCLSLALGFPHSTATETFWLFAAPALKAKMRNELSQFFFFFSPPLVCVCWIIEVNGAFLLRALCASICVQLKQPAVKVVFPLGLCGRN